MTQTLTQNTRKKWLNVEPTGMWFFVHSNGMATAKYSSTF